MSHRRLYVIVGAVVAVLLVVLLATFDYSTPEADEAKAEQLLAAYREAGLSSRLDAEQIAERLGDDGGSVCKAAGDIASGDLARGLLKVRLGVGGEFFVRPAPLDRDTLARALLIVETYCPDDLPGVRDFVDDLDLDEVVRH